MLPQPDMEEIIQPVSREVLKAELTRERYLRSTNKSNNEIYIVTYQQAPNVVREIGRLREVAFRAAGGGTGMALDLDEFDVCDHPYYQLVVWCPETEEILGGYRFLPGSEIEFEENGQPRLATGHMFHFSESFLKDYIRDTVELGRSFVTLEYQSTREVRRVGYNIPPLVNAYMGLSPTMRVFGTAVNHDFGEVEETGILIAVDEILEEKRMRHIDSFMEEHPEAVDAFEDLFINRGK